MLHVSPVPRAWRAGSQNCWVSHVPRYRVEAIAVCGGSRRGTEFLQGSQMSARIAALAEQTDPPVGGFPRFQSVPQNKAVRGGDTCRPPFCCGGEKGAALFKSSHRSRQKSRSRRTRSSDGWILCIYRSVLPFRASEHEGCHNDASDLPEFVNNGNCG